MEFDIENGKKKTEMEFSMNILYEENDKLYPAALILNEEDMVEIVNFFYKIKQFNLI